MSERPPWEQPFVFTGGDPWAGSNPAGLQSLLDAHHVMVELYKEKYDMGEVLPPGAEPVVEPVVPRKYSGSFFEFLKILRADAPIASFNCGETEDGHIYLMAQVAEHVGTRVDENGGQWKNFEMVTGCFYVNEQNQVITINESAPLKAEAAPEAAEGPVSEPVVEAPAAEAPKE